MSPIATMGQVVGIPARPRRWTYEELVAELPATNDPCELWDGEIVMSPAPSFFHQEVSLRFYRMLHAWVSAHGLGEVIAARVDMVLSAHRVVQPDVAFVARERLGIIREAIEGPADLVAEVVSLGSRHRDRIEKRDLYEQHEVREYWIIEPEAQTVDVFAWVGGRYDMVGHGRADQRVASRILPGLEIVAGSLFKGD